MNFVFRMRIFWINYKFKFYATCLLVSLFFLFLSSFLPVFLISVLSAFICLFLTHILSDTIGMCQVFASELWRLNVMPEKKMLDLLLIHFHRKDMEHHETSSSLKTCFENFRFLRNFFLCSLETETFIVIRYMYVSSLPNDIRPLIVGPFRLESLFSA